MRIESPESSSPNIPWAMPSIDDAEMKQVVATMDSGWLTMGPRVEQFEHEMASRVGRKHAVAVTNGTAALDLAMRVLGISRGDEVIVPAFSYVATASAVQMQGATPIFADIDPRNFGLDPARAADQITPATRAILCTDHGGNPCDYGRLIGLSMKHGIPLILDGAQSIGAMYDNRPTLSYGLLSTVSFHAAKTLTCIEGGMVFTDDDQLDRRMRIIRSQGEDPLHKYHHIELGHNFRMTELHAAIGLAQLAKLDGFLARREELAAHYKAQFTAMGLAMPQGIPHAHNSHFLFSLLVPQRDELMLRLKAQGVDTRCCYPMPLYRQPIFPGHRAPPCPVTERICRSILNPPMFHALTTVQQDRVVAELRKAIDDLSREGLWKQAI